MKKLILVGGLLLAVTAQAVVPLFLTPRTNAVAILVGGTLQSNLTNYDAATITPAALLAEVGNTYLSPNGTNDTLQIQAALDSATNFSGMKITLQGRAPFYIENLVFRSNTILDGGGATLYFLPGASGAAFNIDTAGSGNVTNVSIVNFTLNGGSTANYLSPPLQAFMGPAYGLWLYYFSGLANRVGILENTFCYGFIQGKITGFAALGIGMFNSMGNGTAYQYPRMRHDVYVESCFYGIHMAMGNTFDYPPAWGYQPPTGAVNDNQTLNGIEVHKCAVGIYTASYCRIINCALEDNDIGVALNEASIVSKCTLNHCASYAVSFTGTTAGHVAKVSDNTMYAAGGIYLEANGVNMVYDNQLGANPPFNLNCTNPVAGSFLFFNNKYQGTFGVTSGSGVNVKTNSTTATNFVFYGNTSSDSSDTDGRPLPSVNSPVNGYTPRLTNGSFYWTP